MPWMRWPAEWNFLLARVYREIPSTWLFRAYSRSQHAYVWNNKRWLIIISQMVSDSFEHDAVMWGYHSQLLSYSFLCDFLGIRRMTVRIAASTYSCNTSSVVHSSCLSRDSIVSRRAILFSILLSPIRPLLFLYYHGLNEPAHRKIVQYRSHKIVSSYHSTWLTIYSVEIS